MAQKEGAAIFPILLVNFVSTMGYSIVLPFLVILVLNMGGNELSYGFLGATYSFFELIGAPVLGSWSDSVGRRKILLVSEAGTFVAWGIFIVALYLPVHHAWPHPGIIAAITNTVPLLLLFVARAIDGLTGGNISVANAYLADISPREERKRNFGRMTASANLGLIFGPALAGVLGATALGSTLPVAAAMLVSFTSMCVIFFKLRDVRSKTPVADGKVGLMGPITAKHKNGLAVVMKQPNIPYFLLMYFLIYLGFNFFYASFPVYAAQEMHWTVLRLGIFFSVLSGALVIVQGPILSRISKIFSGATLVIAGSVILSGAFLLLGTHSNALLYAGAVLFALGNGIMWPSFLAVMSSATDDDYQGLVQGFAGSTASLASIIGLISGAFFYRMFGAHIMTLSSAFLLLIAVCSYRIIAIEKSIK